MGSNKTCAVTTTAATYKKKVEEPDSINHSMTMSTPPAHPRKISHNLEVITNNTENGVSLQKSPKSERNLKSERSPILRRLHDLSGIAHLHNRKEGRRFSEPVVSYSGDPKKDDFKSKYPGFTDTRGVPVTSLPPQQWKIDSSAVLHKGGCHCGAVRYEVYAPSTPTVIECNCSICYKKQMQHFIVPMSYFKLLQGHDSVKTYTFNTRCAKHIFCSICGVESFFIPKYNPDGYGIVTYTLDEGSVKKLKVVKQDGKNVEDVTK